MAGAETAGILAIAMLLGQGIIELGKFLISKFADKKDESKGFSETQLTGKEVEQIVGAAVKSVLEPQASQLKALYEMHMKFDNDGTPIWYVPRSWAETNKDVVEKLYRIAETQNQTLIIIDRLERRVEQNDHRKG
jgi:hypothetical protein